MDELTNLSKDIVTVISVYLPLLMKDDVSISLDVSVTLTFQLATRIWMTLKPYINSPAIQEVLLDVSTNPSDNDAKELLSLHIKKILKYNSELESELLRIFESIPQGDSESMHSTEPSSDSSHSTMAFSSTGALIGGIIGYFLLGAIGGAIGSGLGAAAGAIKNTVDNKTDSEKSVDESNQ